MILFHLSTLIATVVNLIVLILFGIDRDNRFRDSHQGMVSNTSSSSCEHGEFLVFCSTFPYNDWCEGSKWPTRWMAPWWMDCQDGHLAFACHSHVFPSGHRHHNLWLVFFFSVEFIFVLRYQYFRLLLFNLVRRSMLWSYLALLVWFTCTEEK